jgi:hypothetical protein
MRNPDRTGARATSGTRRGATIWIGTPATATRSYPRTSTTDQRSSSGRRSSVTRADPADRAAQAPADRVAQDPAAQAPADPATPVDRAIRVAPGDMNRVVATADTAATGRVAMTPVGPADQAGRVAMTLADLTTLGGTIPGDPVVMTRVSLGDTTRERPRVHSQAGLATPGDTIPVDRALLGRTPTHPPLTAEHPLRTPALLLLTRADHRARVEATPVDRRCRMEEATRQGEALIRAAAVRPADRTPRLEAIRLVGVTPQAE